MLLLSFTLLLVTGVIGALILGENHSYLIYSIGWFGLCSLLLISGGTWEVMQYYQAKGVAGITSSSNSSASRIFGENFFPVFRWKVMDQSITTSNRVSNRINQLKAFVYACMPATTNIDTLKNAV